MSRLPLIYVTMPIYAGFVLLASFFLTLSILTWADAHQESNPTIQIRPAIQIGVDV